MSTIKISPETVSFSTSLPDIPEHIRPDLDLPIVEWKEGQPFFEGPANHLAVAAIYSSAAVIGVGTAILLKNTAAAGQAYTTTVATLATGTGVGLEVAAHGANAGLNVLSN